MVIFIIIKSGSMIFIVMVGGKISVRIVELIKVMLLLKLFFEIFVKIIVRFKIIKN